MRLHVFGLPHSKISKTLPWAFCAYSLKIYNMCKMFYDEGHEVYLYANTGSDAPCTKLIDYFPEGLFEETHGPITDVSRPDFGAHIPTYQWAKDNFSIAVNNNLKGNNNDIVLSTFGDAFGGETFNNCKAPVVESAIGYPQAHHAHYKVFESHYIRNYVKGLNRDEGPNWSEEVIHGYIDPDDYIFNDTPDDYFLYLARVEDNYASQKGLHLALELQAKFKFNLKIAGPGPGDRYVRDGVEYMGPVWGKQKAELISKAKGLFSMSLYPEPFGYIVIESLMSGTPVIATNHGAFPETVVPGVGFRGTFFRDFKEGVLNIDKIDRKHCRDYAMEHFSLKKQYKKYLEFFEKILASNTEAGWYFEYINKYEHEEDWHNKPGHMIMTAAGHSIFKKELDIGLDQTNKTILDIGGGPHSILLDCNDFTEGVIVDPIDYRQTFEGLEEVFGKCNIDFVPTEMENYDSKGKTFDEIWCYNVLPHADDEKEFFDSLLKCCKPGTIIKITEPINLLPYEGHPLYVTPDTFNYLKDRCSNVIKEKCYNPEGYKWVHGEHIFLILEF